MMQELPRGSMGTVHKARSTQSERVVALRQFEAPQWMDDVDDLLRRIMAEAQAANTLQHPNIVPLLTCGYKDFTVFMTSEFIDGPSAREFMSSARCLSIPEVVSVAKQLGSALDYAHSKGVVHHCLTPTNLKLLPNGTLKILDFGLFKHRHLLSQTAMKKLENEPYLSPEELRKQPIDRSANLFTAATILYELLTTRNPFAGKHLGEVDRNITDVTPYPLNLAHPRVPEAISRVVLKGLSKNPAERFQSGEELAKALEDAMQGVPMRAATAAMAAKATSSQSAPAVDVGERTIKISPPASVTTSTRTPVAAKVQPTTTQTKVAGTAAKAQSVAAKPVVSWKLVAAGIGGLLLIGVAAVALMRRSPAAPRKDTPTAQSVPVDQSGSVSAPGPEVIPALEVRELAPKPGKPQGKSGKAAEAATPLPIAPAMAELTITSSPAGALVEIEGRSGQPLRTPVTVSNLAAGSYRLTFSMAGYAAETRNVSLVGGTRGVADVRLTPTRGTLSVGGNPAGAKILIDGRDSGRLTPTDFTLDPGVHQIVLRREGYLDSESSIKLVAGQIVSFAPSLRVAGRTDNIKTVGGLSKMFGAGGSSSMGRLEIRTQPKGAQIMINGTPFSKTTPVDIQLEPGNYNITLQKDGYKPVRKSVTVTLGDKLRIDETMAQQ
jgi:serine/threonine-protein kinase